MQYRRRLLLLLAVLSVVALPALALRAACAGNSCGSAATGPARVPFCALPQHLRQMLAAGFRDSRSPDVLAVPRAPVIRVGADGIRAPWPSIDHRANSFVPLVFAGTGVDPRAEVPAGTGLTAVAGTLAEIAGFQRPFPMVERGSPVPGLAANDKPRLILVVAWKGVGASELRDESWPFLRSLMTRGAGSLRATTGSLPLDPAAILTTIGTGVLPSEHGITGTQLRNDAGELTRAWGPGAPLSVVTTLGDDLDEFRGQRPLVGLVGTDEADRGVVGGTWYEPHDDDADAFVAPKAVAEETGKVLLRGFGGDAETDLLAVVMRDSVAHMDRELERVVSDARRASGGSLTVVVAGTGSSSVTGESGAGGDGGVPEVVPLRAVLDPVERAIPGAEVAVESAAAGGIFLNQAALADAGVSSSVAVRALLAERGADGEPVFADAFPAFAVSFARYCDRGA